MKISRTFEKDFSSPKEGWRFLSYLSSQIQNLDTSGLKLEFDYKSLKIILEGGDAALEDVVANCFKSDNESFVKLFCDGGSRGNPGPGASGFVLLNSHDEQIAQGGQFFKHCTNNYAEYMSLKDGMEESLRRGIQNLKIYMDSQLVVKQIKGEYKIRNKDLFPIYKAIKSGLVGVSSYEITYIPRSHNRLADSVVNQILDDNV